MIGLLAAAAAAAADDDTAAVQNAASCTLDGARFKRGKTESGVRTLAACRCLPLLAAAAAASLSESTFPSLFESPKTTRDFNTDILQQLYFPNVP
jgi:hypothetical protein